MATWSGSHNVDDFQQLEFAIGTETSEILEYVMENVVLPQLLDLIERDVYSYHGQLSQNFWDGRSGDFKNAWKLKIQKQGFYNNIILYIDDNEFSYQMSHPFSHMTDSASGLAEIINEGWDSSSYPLPPYHFPAMYARPYWDDFIEWMNDNFEYEFIKECNNRGLNMTVTGDLSF